MEGSMKDEEVDKLVLQWLKKRKFSESLKVLELELQVKTGQQASADRQLLPGEAEVSLEGVLLGTAGGGDPTSYATELAKLEAWVDGSLDIYRPELLHLLYVVFVHTYLQLVNLGAAAIAHGTLTEHKQAFLAAAISARQKKGREAELHELLSLSTPEQLEASGMARALRAQRTVVRLSKDAYDLLLHYLRQADMMLVLGVINQWIAVEVLQGGATAVALGDTGLLGAGATSQDADTVNMSDLELRLLQQSALKVFEEEVAKREEAEAAEKVSDETGTKKEKQARQKAAAEAKDRLEKVGGKYIESQLPLPPVVDEAQAALVEDVRHSETAGAGGKPVSPMALPSAAFITFVNTQQTLNAVAVSSNASRVAAGFADSSLRVYELDGTAPAAPPAVYRGHSGPVYAADFSPDDKLLVSASGDGTVRLWSTELSAGLVAFSSHMLPVWDVEFAPEHGYYFASASADRTARVWATERSQPLRVFVGHQGDVDVVRWHPNCHYIGTGSSDKSVRLWDLRTGTCARMLLGHNAPITALAFSPDGKTLASADTHGVVNLWDLAAAQRLATSTAHTGPVWSLGFSQWTGKLLASGGSDCTVRLWGCEGGEAATLPCEATWCTKATPVASICFTARNLLLAAGPLKV